MLFQLASRQEISGLVFFELSLQFCISFENFSVIFAPLAIQAKCIKLIILQLIRFASGFFAHTILMTSPPSPFGRVFAPCLAECALAGAVLRQPTGISPSFLGVEGKSEQAPVRAFNAHA